MPLGWPSRRPPLGRPRASPPGWAGPSRSVSRTRPKASGRSRPRSASAMRRSLAAGRSLPPSTWSGRCLGASAPPLRPSRSAPSRRPHPRRQATCRRFELGVRPMAISRGVNHRSPHPRVAKSRDSYPLGARLFQRFPSGKRFSIGSRHGSLPVRETPWCRPSGTGSIVGEAPLRHLPPGADLYG